jgi:hypothetical protein
MLKFVSASFVNKITICTNRRVVAGYWYLNGSNHSKRWYQHL